MQNWISRSLHHTGFDCNAISLRAPYFECVHQIPLVCIAFKFCEVCAFKREKKVFLQVVTFLLSPADFPLVPDFSQWILNTSKSVQIHVLSVLAWFNHSVLQAKRIAVEIKMDILNVSLCCVLCLLSTVCVFQRQSLLCLCVMHSMQCMYVHWECLCVSYMHVSAVLVYVCIDVRVSVFAVFVYYALYAVCVCVLCGGSRWSQATGENSCQAATRHG